MALGRRCGVLASVLRPLACLASANVVPALRLSVAAGPHKSKLKRHRRTTHRQGESSARLKSLPVASPSDSTSLGMNVVAAGSGNVNDTRRRPATVAVAVCIILSWLCARQARRQAARKNTNVSGSEKKHKTKGKSCSTIYVYHTRRIMKATNGHKLWADSGNRPKCIWWLAG